MKPNRLHLLRRNNLGRIRFAKLRRYTIHTAIYATFSMWIKFTPRTRHSTATSPNGVDFFFLFYSSNIIQYLIPLPDLRGPHSTNAGGKLFHVYVICAPPYTYLSSHRYYNYEKKSSTTIIFHNHLATKQKKIWDKARANSNHLSRADSTPFKFSAYSVQSHKKLTPATATWVFTMMRTMLYNTSTCLNVSGSIFHTSKKNEGFAALSQSTRRLRSTSSKRPVRVLYANSSLFSLSFSNNTLIKPVHSYTDFPT